MLRPIVGLVTPDIYMLRPMKSHALRLIVIRPEIKPVVLVDNDAPS